MDIKAPTFPESIADGSVAEWHYQVGDFVAKDDLLVDIETDKVVIEVYAPADGTLSSIFKGEGETVLSEEVIAQFSEGAAVATQESSSPAEAAVGDSQDADRFASPAAKKLAAENNLDWAAIAGTGKNGRITKEDVTAALSQSAPDAEPIAAEVAPQTATEPSAVAPKAINDEGRIERRVPMTRLRASVAKRLVAAQQNAAMLTTFNEVDMQPIMTLRKRYQAEFQKAHNDTRLGFMSFFVRAATEALKRFPAVNASIDGDDIVYHGYYDIGVAVSTERGLVVPVLRDTDALGLAQIEDEIAAFGAKARDGKLALEDMAGGTFTISNGGIFGSMMSTPILNPPQTGVLGMHNIQDRAVVVDGEIVVRPMMYLALSYDHRLIDGREAVQFLVAIKGMIEDPARILLEL
ncbi:MAG: 2-oxoglutarate dehydrogenase complex dihydrolipoyllysine-residue succinyltransferase [Pseudomonadota bacterium]|nr:2-oxoglutarate dehydrogenase complex dihydrolipoyllysine-residue succinyltransferase [Pseudomonadota bacterium]MEC7251402.1 2-oxoglutarate dehydrogenase complex dihydrolipoyllysine-residue succinyltransferase [Pseudomonadota bacterium]MEC7419824.1 2-oxoglutarate dehydrogenase complex dihydrolipoyllysine-residue succinyltransferase [Pseudomonadota bacterium]MEC7957189.1 2-oxoglutarate dehydrogenase complex dihydrolipoyllysine-residue succinyltransferase [Pseudomonadota bacterium]MEC7968959.1 